MGQIIGIKSMRFVSGLIVSEPAQPGPAVSDDQIMVKGQKKNGKAPAAPEMPHTMSLEDIIAALDAKAESVQQTDPESAAQMAGAIEELKRLQGIIEPAQEEEDKSKAKKPQPAETENAALDAAIIAGLRTIAKAKGFHPIVLTRLTKALRGAPRPAPAPSPIEKAKDGKPLAGPVGSEKPKTKGEGERYEGKDAPPTPVIPPPKPEELSLQDKGEHWFVALVDGEIHDMVIKPVKGADGVQAVYGEPEILDDSASEDESLLVGYMFVKDKWDETKIKAWLDDAPMLIPIEPEATKAPSGGPAKVLGEVANALRTGPSEPDVECALDDVPAKGVRYEIIKIQDPATGEEIEVAEGWAGIVKPGWTKDSKFFYVEAATLGKAKLAEGKPVCLDHPDEGKRQRAKAIHGHFMVGTGHTHERRGKCATCRCRSKGDNLEVAKFRIHDEGRVRYLKRARIANPDHRLNFSYRGQIMGNHYKRPDGSSYDVVNDIVLFRSIDEVFEGRFEEAEALEHAAAMPAQGGATTMPDITINESELDRKARAARRVAVALTYAADHCTIAGYGSATHTQSWIREVSNGAEPDKLDELLAPGAIEAKAKELDIENTPAPLPAARCETIEPGRDVKDTLTHLVDAHISYISPQDHLTGKPYRAREGGDARLLKDLADAAGLRISIDKTNVKTFITETCCAMNRMAEMEAQRPKKGLPRIEDTNEREKVALQNRAMEVENSLRAAPAGGRSGPGAEGSSIMEVENAISLATLSHVTADRLKKRPRMQFVSILKDLGMNAPADIGVSTIHNENDTISVRSVNVAWPDTIPAVAQLANYVTLAAPASEEEVLTPTLYGAIQEFSEEYSKADTLGFMQLYIERMGITLDYVDYLGRFTPFAANSLMDDGIEIFHTAQAAAGRANRRNVVYSFNDMIQTLLLGIGRTDFSTGVGANAMVYNFAPVASVNTRDNWVQVQGNNILKERPDTGNRDGNVLTAVAQWNGMSHYCQAPWTAQGYTATTIIFGDAKKGPIGDLIRYEGRDTAETFFTDKRDGYPGLYSNVIVAKVRKGFGYRVVSPRNVLRLG